MSEYVRHILFHIEHGEFKHIQTIVDHIFVGIVLSLVWFCMEIEKTHGVYEKNQGPICWWPEICADMAMDINQPYKRTQ